jgi:hypothetical protein
MLRPAEPAAPLRVDRAVEPVSGILAQAQRPSQMLSGWFELIGVLEDAVRAALKTAGMPLERPTR